MARKTRLFDVFAGLLFLVLFVAFLIVMQWMKSDQPRLAPPEPRLSILESEMK